jgi:hypothetical protein
MNYLITENQVSNLAMTYLNGMYHLEEYRTEKHPEIVFFIKEDKVYVEWDVKNSGVFISKRLMHEIRRHLENIFGLGIYDGRKVFDMWIGQYVDTSINDVHFSETLPYTVNEL